jgi:hypothetical protein
MAHHGRAGKHTIPPANRPGRAPATPAVVEELASEKTKARGRTAKTNPIGPEPTEPHTPQEMRREVNRPQSAGVKKRGDRKDTVPDPGMRGTGHNRSIRTPPARALTGKRNITGKRANASRGRQG